MSERYDIVVIGSGPGGYVAAIRAAQLGQRTAIVERDALGGICLNWGCIPTKALLRTAEVFDTVRHADAYGLKPLAPEFDLAAVVKRSRAVAGQLSAGVKFLMKKNAITVIEGTARLTGGRTLEVTPKAGGPARPVEAEKGVILATGARARTLPGLAPDGRLVWTYREAMVPDVFPRRLLVIGSGAIGVEFASFYATLGAEVTLVEVMDRILPAEDAEIAALADKAFRKAGIRILTGAKLSALTPGGNEVRATIEAGGKTETASFDRAILAIGITGNVEDLGLEALGVRIEKGHVVVDPWGATGVDGLYAIGDLVGPPWLAHKASHEGVVAAERLAGHEGAHPNDPSNIPGCTYSLPQIASVGLTEARAREAGHEIRVGRFPFRANGKALALGHAEGMVKTIFDATTGALLGAHLIGPEVTELIQGFALARTLETTEAELMATVFPHPTLSEAMHESVLDAFGRALHS